MPISEVSLGAKQHAVPQNIMQVEFKVIGELTMRQFAYLVLGAVFAFATYASGLPKFIAIPLALCVAGLALAVAFLPIQDRSMDVWVVNFFLAVYTPTQRIWRKEAEPPSYFLYQNARQLKNEMLAVAPTASRRKLEQYLERQGNEHPLDPIEQREAEYIKKVRDSFENIESAQTKAQKGTTLFKPYNSVQAQVAVETPVVAPPQLQTEAPSLNMPPPMPKVEPQPVVPQTPAPMLKPEEPAKIPEPIKEAQGVEEKAMEVQKENVVSAKPVAENKPEAPKPQQKITQQLTPTAVSNAFRVNDTNKKPRITYTPYNSITPDRLTGRRFTHLTTEQGEIVLPIRGEKVLSTVQEEKKIDLDLEKKTKDLMMLIEKIKKEASTQTAKLGAKLESKAQTPSQTELAKKEVQSAANQLKTSNDSLAKEIEELKRKMQDSNATDKQKFEMELLRLQNEKKVADTEISALQQKINELQQKLYQTVQTQKQGYSPISNPMSSTQTTTQKPQDKIVVTPLTPTELDRNKASQPVQEVLKPNIPPPVKETPKDAKPANFAQTPSIASQPNLINGIVKDKNGKLMESVVVIIKDPKDDVVRALKTNQLGQFVITTPVSNGRYKVEITKPDEDSPNTFEPASVEVKGEVLPPIEFIGKL